MEIDDVFGDFVDGTDEITNDVESDGEENRRAAVMEADFRRAFDPP